LLHFVFLPPTLFSGCGRVHFASLSSSSLGIVQIPQAPFVLCSHSFVSSATLQSHHHELFTQASVTAFSRSFRFAGYTSFAPSSRTLAQPRKKLHYAQKIAPALRVPRSQPQPSFRFAALRAIRVCHPRSTRRRLAPLHSAGKKSLRYAPPIFYPLRSGSRLFYLHWFSLRPRQPLTTHP
jgi:hypothetical protein